MLNVLECKNLTKEELIEFINLGLPYLKDMELKNNWDFFVNEIGFTSFCEELFQYAIKVLKQEELFFDKYCSYPKVNEINDFFDIVEEKEFFKEEEKRIKQKEDITIWELIYNKLKIYIEDLY